VLESGLLDDAGDRYVLRGPLPSLAIPSTLHASLLARLDRLAAVKEVAQTAAAIGREFSYALIAVVAGLPERELQAALAQLVAAELVFQRGPPTPSTCSTHWCRMQPCKLCAAAASSCARSPVRSKRSFPTSWRASQVLAHRFTAAGLTERGVLY
jgi:hypothetical protein